MQYIALQGRVNNQNGNIFSLKSDGIPSYKCIVQRLFSHHYYIQVYTHKNGQIPRTCLVLAL